MTKKMMRRLIRTDGSFIDFTSPVPVAKVMDLIGAACVDSVTLHHMGKDPLHVMFVDDLGYDTKAVHHPNGVTELRTVKARKPVNLEATKLYLANCRAGHTHQIVGDVLIVPDSDYAQAL